MTHTNIRFSLVVLCYRAEESIISFVGKLHQMLSFYKHPYEIILVGNYFEHSNDITPTVVKELAAQLPNTRAIILPKQGMMGWDMKAGMDAARGEFIGVIDGDGQFPIESIFSCLVKIDLENLDLVKTYRAHRQDGLYRKIVSSIYNLVFKILFNTHFYDINSKPKIIRRSKYKLFQLQSNDWFTDAEIMICAKRLGLKVAEIPTQFYRLKGRHSFVKPQAVFEFICNLIKFRFFKTTPIYFQHDYIEEENLD